MKKGIQQCSAVNVDCFGIAVVGWGHVKCGNEMIRNVLMETSRFNGQLLS